MSAPRTSFAVCAMPSAKPPRFYFDACVFLAFISGETGRVETIDELLKVSKAGKLKVLTSTLSIVEVSYAASEKIGGVLDPAIEARIDNLWNDRAAVTLIEVTAAVNRKAREFMRDGLRNGWKLRPPDAIHLASAVMQKAEEFYTYNLQDFKRYETITGIKISEPYLTQTILGL